MVPLNKIFLVLFSVLIIVIIVEAGYLFFQAKDSSDPNSSAKSTITSSPNPQITKKPVDSQEKNNSSAEVSRTTTIRYRGKILRIDKNPVIKKNDSGAETKYDFRWDIKGKGINVSQIFFNNNILKVTKFVTKQGDKETPIVIGDFKIGDEVIITRSTTKGKVVGGKVIKTGK